MKSLIVFLGLISSVSAFGGEFLGDLNGSWTCHGWGEIQIAGRLVSQDGKVIAKFTSTSIPGVRYPSGTAPISNEPTGLFIFGHECYKQ